jgi:hypothetical protein
VDGVMEIRLWDEGAPTWDIFNVPVWKANVESVLFVRTYSPRINSACTDVILDTSQSFPGLASAVDVTELLSGMD